jgi:S1-C subfamily serine protease
MSSESGFESEKRPTVARGQSRSVNGWLILILLMVFGVLVYRMAGGLPSSLHDLDAEPRAVTPRGDLLSGEQTQIALYREASPSVVYITTMTVEQYGLSRTLEIPQGTGSGFVWDDTGNIVTNFHVIRDAEVARVTLADNSTYDAVIVGVAPDKDLAVLKIDAPAGRLKPLRLGTSANLQVGQNVLAIGSPFQLDQTLTTGVISGLGREIQSVTRRPIQGVIQTDAAINPGNSGGPLLDTAGRLIGINTAIYSPSGAYAGIGFAVPVDTVNQIVPQLIRYGKVERPGLGIEPFDSSVVQRLFILDELSEMGVLVKNVMPESAAERSGMLPTRRSQTDKGPEILLGDLIVAIEGKTIASNNDLFKALDGRKVGDVISIDVMRDGKKINLSLTLRELK